MRPNPESFPDTWAVIDMAGNLRMGKGTGDPSTLPIAGATARMKILPHTPFVKLLTRNIQFAGVQRASSLRLALQTVRFCR